MALNQFTVGRIQQMRAGKGYLGAHPSWRAPAADTTCARCGLEPETSEHAILTCPARQGARAGLLHCVTCVGQEAPLWFSLPLLNRLAAYFSVTSTGFPPTMFPPTTPPSSPPCSLSPPIRTPPYVSSIFPV